MTVRFPLRAVAKDWKALPIVPLWKPRYSHTLGLLSYVSDTFPMDGLLDKRGRGVSAYLPLTLLALYHPKRADYRRVAVL